jgi:hypothetical protein
LIFAQGQRDYEWVSVWCFFVWIYQLLKLGHDFQGEVDLPGIELLEDPPVGSGPLSQVRVFFDLMKNLIWCDQPVQFFKLADFLP